MSKITLLFIFVNIPFGLVLADPVEMVILKNKFDKNQNRSEYLERLADLREQYVNNRAGEDVLAVDIEVLKYPLPGNVNGEALSQQRLGQWQSPRHTYIYRKDGTWIMLPNVDGSTHGRWLIEGNQYFDWVPSLSSEKPGYTIILLDHGYFIFAAGGSVFYERQIQ